MAIREMLREVHWQGNEGEIACLAALCPACGFEHHFRVDLTGNGRWPDEQGVWEFNGDYASPTFKPSMFSNAKGLQEQFPQCHSFVTDGKWHFLTDCTHAMAGQVVDMVPPDPAMTWEQRHGWHLIDERYRNEA